VILKVGLASLIHVDIEEILSQLQLVLPRKVIKNKSNVRDDFSATQNSHEERDSTFGRAALALHVGMRSFLRELQIEIFSQSIDFSLLISSNRNRIGSEIVVNFRISSEDHSRTVVFFSENRRVEMLKIG
jgi:hypothetical protein